MFDELRQTETNLRTIKLYLELIAQLGAPPSPPGGSSAELKGSNSRRPVHEGIYKKKNKKK